VNKEGRGDGGKGVNEGMSYKRKYS
jgi:hypothetical protein